MLIECFSSVDIFHTTKLSQVLLSKTVNIQLITEKTWTPSLHLEHTNSESHFQRVLLPKNQVDS